MAPLVMPTNWALKLLLTRFPLLPAIDARSVMLLPEFTTPLVEFTLNPKDMQLRSSLLL